MASRKKILKQISKHEDNSTKERKLSTGQEKDNKKKAGQYVDIILKIDEYLSKVGHNRAERHRFRAGWIKNADLRKQFAKRIVS